MSEGQSTSIDARAPGGARIAASVAGVVAAVAFGFATAGIAVIATLATLVAFAVARRRGSRLTRGASWLIGVGTVGVALMAGFGVLVARLPAGTFTNFRRAMDSTATVPPPPPPEWLRRITPPTAQVRSQATDRLVRSQAFMLWVAVISVGLGVGVIAGLTGSLGWAAGLLLLYGIDGAWLPRAPPVGPP